MEEGDKVALTGTIGTWVAVVLALIALIAVIGPVLVWAAARTERNRALHHADDTNHSFISTGIHFVGLDVRLFRRVRAPVLDKNPEDPILIWGATHFIETNSRATWIQLANILLGYQVPLQRGDNLVIYRGRVLLPVHRIWILIICLCGRYSTTRKSIQNPRRSITNRVAGSVRFKTPEVGLPDEGGVDSTPWSFQTTLNGATGQIKISEKITGLGLSDSPVVTFSPRPAADLAGIETEKVSMQDLLMLASGCLPTPSNQYIILIELWSHDDLQVDHQSIDFDISSTMRLMTRKASGHANIILNDGSGDRQDSSVVRRPRSSSSRKSSLHVEGNITIPEPVVLRLENIRDRDEEMDRLTNSFGQMKEILAFEPQIPGIGLSTDLKRHFGTTFIDPSFDWIRIPTVDDSSDEPSNVFIWRADAHKVALALLKLPWHPQGYLIGGSSSAYCIRMLEFSGLQFLYLLTRIRENIALLTVSSQEKNLLKERLEAADRITRRQQSGVSISSQNEFYELDSLLSNSGHAEEKVNDMIGILMMTNEEFASFIRQASRHFANSITGTLEVVLRTGIIKVKLPFGGVQDFPVDMRDLYTDWQPRDETITVNYTVVVLACLRASLRSYLLNIRFDGFPLMREILKMDDVIHVA